MACLPLIERELRVALRKQRPAKTRFKIAALAAAGSALFLLTLTPVSSRSAGRSLEQLLFVVGLYSVLRAPMLIAGVLAEERRNETLGLLFVSGLSASEVLVGKFLSSILVACTNLLAIFPMLALPFLIGGVSFDLFLATMSSLPVLMLFAVSVSLLASVLTREDGAAVVVAYAFIAAICVAPIGIQAVLPQTISGSGSSWWLRANPAYGLRLIWNGFFLGFNQSQRIEVLYNLVFTLAWSGLAIGSAAFGLNRLWRERELERSLIGWRARWHDFLHGGREVRRRLAETWLGSNPFVWMAGRDRQTVVIAALVFGGIMIVWALWWVGSPPRWPTPINYYITALALNIILAWLARYTAARAVGEPRRDGSYELLLTTPLIPADIVWGTLEALRFLFRPIVYVVLFLNALMMLAGLMSRRWTIPALVVYFCVWLFFMTWTWSLGQRWTRVVAVMWASLNCGRPALALWRTSGFNSWSWFGTVAWVWILYNLPKTGFRRFPTGTAGEIVIGCCFVGVWLLLRLGRYLNVARPQIQDLEWDPEAKVWRKRPGPGWAPTSLLEKRLIREFREIVREPLPDPHDPRFKRWKVQGRFPWGWEIIQQQLHERLARK